MAVARINQSKFKLAMVSIVLVSLGALTCHLLTGFESVYTTYVSAILGILTIYSGGNLGQEYLVRKHGVLPNEVQDAGQQPGPGKQG